MEHKIDNNNKSIIVGPDYAQLAKQQTNSAIIEKFLAYLFAPKTNNKGISFWILIRNLSIALLIKIILEDSKGYLDNFKFTNLDYVKYMYQYFKYSEKKYELLLVSNKWTYLDKNMSTNTLTPFLESKAIYMSQHNTYYYPYQGFLIKVIVTNNKITFCTPQVSMIDIYINDLLTKHQEILLGNKTQMFKAKVTNSDVIQFEPMSPTYAFETDNYKKLHDCLNILFSVDSILKIRQTPLVINFNGPPGTGKTSFAPYIANKGVFDRIILYNMVQSNLDFKTLLNKLEMIIVQQSPKERSVSAGPEAILLIFDEVDKWFNSYSEKFIDTMRTESRSKKEIKQSGQGSEPVILESFTKLTLDEETDKKKQLQKEFLDKLYNLCEGQTLKNDKKYVIIFNTNNFDSLFENCSTKYDALKDRFQKYEFKKINKDGIIKYFSGIKQNLINESSDNNCIDTIINFDETIYDLIPENIEISYRSLSKILIDNCFDIVKTINFLANGNDKSELQTIIEQF